MKNPCGGCGSLLVVNRNSRPVPLCHACRHAARLPKPTSGPCASCGSQTSRRAAHLRWRCLPCSELAKRAYDHNRHTRRRRAKERASDLTAEAIIQLRTEATHCPMPGCGVEMSENWSPHDSRSKELDHRVPLNVGGTHTRDNVRIICRGCNRARPLDGSDL